MKARARSTESWWGGGGLKVLRSVRVMEGHKKESERGAQDEAKEWRNTTELTWLWDKGTAAVCVDVQVCAAATPSFQTQEMI